MKIAITSLYLPSGSKIGVGYQVHYLANALTQRGHSVTVFSQTGASPDSLYDVIVVPPGRRMRTFSFAWDLRGYDLSKFDVLNAHGDDWFLWGRKRPRHIHTFHGSCMAEMLHARGLAAKVRMGMLAACEYNACMLADALVAVSENTRRYIPFVRRVIPNGVDLSAFSPGKTKSAAPSLLFVGTMSNRKRGAMLLDIFNREIRTRIPNAEFWAVCEEPVSGNGVQWFGRVPKDKLTELYREAWVFCLPSTYEGFGVPYIEAMASGTPVVATGNVGAREVLRDGASGVIAEEDELGHVINELFGDDELRAKYREAGLMRAQDFSWDRVCAQYEALYHGGSEASPEPAIASPILSRR